MSPGGVWFLSWSCSSSPQFGLACVKIRPSVSCFSKLHPFFGDSTYLALNFKRFCSITLTFGHGTEDTGVPLTPRDTEVNLTSHYHACSAKHGRLVQLEVKLQGAGRNIMSHVPGIPIQRCEMSNLRFVSVKICWSKTYGVFHIWHPAL